MKKLTKKDRERRLIRKTIRMLSGKYCKNCRYSDIVEEKLFCNFIKNASLLYKTRKIIEDFYIKNEDDYCNHFKYEKD